MMVLDILKFIFNQLYKFLNMPALLVAVLRWLPGPRRYFLPTSFYHPIVIIFLLARLFYAL